MPPRITPGTARSPALGSIGQGEGYVAAARFPEVIRADLAELEVAQMRQLTNAHCADEHNR